MTVSIIADYGSCWRASPDEPLDKGWDRLRRILDAVKAAGASTAKGQYYRADLIYPAGSKEHALLRGYELPEEWLPQIKAECDARSLEFLMTVYDPSHVPLIDPHVSRFKVASFENEHAGLRAAIAATGKPVIVSMGGIDGVRRTAIWQEWTDLIDREQVTPLHCVSAYPATSEQMNLKVIAVWNVVDGAYGGDDIMWADPRMGLSDHTLSSNAAVIAVAYGAQIIERHVKAQDSGQGPDAHFASGPATFSSYVARIRLTEEMIGSGELRVQDGEKIAWRYDAMTGRRGTA